MDESVKNVVLALMRCLRRRRRYLRKIPWDLSLSCSALTLGRPLAVVAAVMALSADEGDLGKHDWGKWYVMCPQEREEREEGCEGRDKHHYTREEYLSGNRL